VLLVGLDSASGSYVVKDPARPEEALSVPAARLERARTAHGRYVRADTRGER